MDSSIVRKAAVRLSSTSRSVTISGVRWRTTRLPARSALRVHSNSINAPGRLIAATRDRSSTTGPVDSKEQTCSITVRHATTDNPVSSLGAQMRASPAALMTASVGEGRTAAGRGVTTSTAGGGL